MTVLQQGHWNWPSATDFDIQEIISCLPIIYPQQTDIITWRSSDGKFTTAAAISLLQPPSPQVLWHRLLGGKFKIPRHDFILWLALLGRLSTMDRPWVIHNEDGCVLCDGSHMETHEHLFFNCSYSAWCIAVLKRCVRFRWPGFGWPRDILWASKDGEVSTSKNAAARTLLASMVYNIWMERNSRRFLATSSSAESVALKAIEETRLRIISEDSRPSLQLYVLYRVWKIPWDRG
ncbi:UNVERIFIED_CONTAM: hypothetical protein Slati_2219800 [Sesamum latifolium]|uniref:Reverse transcriptase zinc-binding domain-containing protein n=1 Tax=Sesamum latifolium TaxID=2727402 RepID=A0AAW2WYE3_9LAMI